MAIRHAAQHGLQAPADLPKIPPFHYSHNLRFPLRVPSAEGGSLAIGSQPIAICNDIFPLTRLDFVELVQRMADCGYQI